MESFVPPKHVPWGYLRSGVFFCRREGGRDGGGGGRGRGHDRRLHMVGRGRVAATFVPTTCPRNMSPRVRTSSLDACGLHVSLLSIINKKQLCIFYYTQLIFSVAYITEVPCYSVIFQENVWGICRNQMSPLSIKKRCSEMFSTNEW